MLSDFRRSVSIQFFGVVALLVLSIAGARGDTLFDLKAPLAPEAFIQLVLERNPTIAAAELAWRGVLTRERQVTAFDDPMLAYSVAPLTAASGESKFGQKLELRQSFPWPGQRGLRAAVARAEAAVARSDWQSVQIELAESAALAYLDYYVAWQSLRITQEHGELLRDLRGVAESSYVAGLAAQQDPIQAEVESTQLEQRRIRLDAQIRNHQARMNQLLHRDLSAEIPPPIAVLNAEIEIPARLEDLLLQAGNAPSLRRTEDERERAEAELKMRKAEGRPDLEAMASYESLWDLPEQTLMIGASVQLPVRKKRRAAAIEEASFEVERSRLRRDAALDEVRFELAEAMTELDAAEQVAALHRDRLLGAARDQAAAARSGFETGRNTFMALLEAQRNVLSVELSYQEALADLHRWRFRLFRAMGRLPDGLVLTGAQENQP